MSIVMCLSADGKIKSFKLVHKSCHQYFGGDTISFCGSIPELDIVAICRKIRQKDDKLNEFSIEFPDCFEETYGEILLIGSDAHGQECDVDIMKTLNYLKK